MTVAVARAVEVVVVLEVTATVVLEVGVGAVLVEAVIPQQEQALE